MRRPAPAWGAARGPSREAPPPSPGGFRVGPGTLAASGFLLLLLSIYLFVAATIAPSNSDLPPGTRRHPTKGAGGGGGRGATAAETAETDLSHKLAALTDGVKELHDVVRRRTAQEAALGREVRDLAASLDRLSPSSSSLSARGGGGGSEAAVATPSELRRCLTAVTGERCLFPALDGNKTYTTCEEYGGFCPVALDLRGNGAVLRRERCGGVCSHPDPWGSAAAAASKPAWMGREDVIVHSAYYTPITRTADGLQRGEFASAQGGQCDCGGGVVLPTPPRAREVHCGYLCAAEFRSTGEARRARIEGWRRSREPPAEVVTALFASFDAAPTRGESLAEASEFVPPAWESVRQHYAGAGIATFSGGERLATVTAAFLYLKQRYKTALPIEIWRDSTEVGVTEGLLRVSAAHDISHCVLPASAGVGRMRWEKRWRKGKENKHVLAEKMRFVTLKATVALLSSFETVLFLDDDAMPVIDPISLLHLLDNRHSGVFFRDIWSLWKDAKIWDHYPWPGGERQYYPAQDSGVFVVSKAHAGGEGWTALATSVFMNYYHLHYYPAVYLGGFKKLEEGFEAIGTGDKDLFQVAWIARKANHRMMGPVAFVGAEGARCGSSLGQPDEAGLVSVVHFNGHKFKYTDWKDGRWNDYKANFCAAIYKNKRTKTINYYDGVTLTQVKWLKSTHQTETYCLQWHKQIETRAYPEHIPIDFQPSFVDSLSDIFASQWMIEYADSFGLRQWTPIP